MTFHEAIAFALTLPGTSCRPATASRRSRSPPTAAPSCSPSHEPDTSFGVAIDRDTIEILKETEPETYWQTPHYEGWEGVLIRYDGRDQDRVRETIARARADRGQAEGAAAQGCGSEPLHLLRRDRLVGREGRAAQGHCDRRSARRSRAAAGPAGPRVVARGGAALAGEARRQGADPVRLRFQLRPADRRARRISARRARRADRRARHSGPMSTPAAAIRTSAPRASSKSPIASISISASPTG